MRTKEQMLPKLSPGKIIVSFIMFILLWASVTDAWGYSQLIFGEESNWGTCIYGLISRFVWVIPAFILLQLYSGTLPTKLKELFTSKPEIKPLVISCAAIVIYVLAVMFISHGGFWINTEFNFSQQILTFSMVALVEELVFRGWGQNALSVFWSAKKSNLSANIFFVLLHLPAYLIKLCLYGTISIAAMATQFVMVSILGILFGYLYRKGNSLWSPMIVHFLGDFLSVMLIG